MRKKAYWKNLRINLKSKEYAWVYDDNKLAELYQASDIFLMPSNYESFGMMAIEAMSSGVPVLSIKGRPLNLLQIHLNAAYRSNLQSLLAACKI